MDYEMLQQHFNAKVLLPGMIRYAFILGHVPVLSSIEAKKLVPDLAIESIAGGILIGTSDGLGPKALMERSGGIVKIARFALSVQRDQAAEACSSLLAELIPEGKITFGISSYGETGYSDAVAMRIKKTLKDKGRSVRHVRGKEPVLNGAELAFNDFGNPGHVEFCIVPTLSLRVHPKQSHFIAHTQEIVTSSTSRNDNLIDIYITEAFQDVRSFVALEEVLNARDDRSGVLPLRLAKMLVNIAGAKPTDTVLDPFCGSGIFVSVGAVLGIRDIIASDSSLKAVQDTRKNVDNVIACRGVLQCAPTSNNIVQVEQWDVRTLSKRIPEGSIDIIVTEPYLGPQTRMANDNELGQMKTLYHEAFKKFRKIVKPGGTVLFIFPLIHSEQDFGEVQRSIRGMGFQKIDLMEGIRGWFPNEVEPVYSRPRQRVKRLITMWKRV